MSDDKLAIEEARRAAQHESVKNQVEGDVQAEIGERAAVKTYAGESQTNRSGRRRVSFEGSKRGR